MSDREDERAHLARVRLAASEEIRRADSTFYGDRRFMHWLDADLQAPQRAGEGWTEEEIAAAAERIEARLTATRLRVELVTGEPQRRRSTASGTIAQVLDEAAAARCAPELDLAVAAGAGRAIWDEPSERWVSVPDHLSNGRYVALTVAGESMLPVMHPGDVVLVELGAPVARDTVVVARLPDDGYVVKRVARTAVDEIELASLNAAFASLVVPRDERTIVGRVVMRWCAHEVRERARSA
jgi:phage repressor protein C with HTH and peptisase S24 domain